MEQLVIDDAIRKYIHNLVSGWFGSTHPDLDDMVQESMLQLWKTATKFQGRCATKSWAYRIAKNRCLNCIRSKKQMVPIEKCESKNWVAPDLDAEHAIQKNEIIEQVEKTLAQLTPAHRQLLQSTMAGETYKSMSIKLHLPINTIGSMIHRAKAKFIKAAMGDHLRIV